MWGDFCSLAKVSRAHLKQVSGGMESWSGEAWRGSSAEPQSLRWAFTEHSFQQLARGKLPHADSGAFPLELQLLQGY